MRETVEQRRVEFEAHLWDHASDPFQTSFDVRRPLVRHELEILSQLVVALSQGQDNDTLASTLRSLLVNDPAAIFPVMQIAGLTRNKIIVDLRASNATRGIRIPGRPEALPRSTEAWSYAGPYLAERIRKVLEPVADLSHNALPQTIEALNQATYPGWIRQERAKRQGHEAEHRVAVLLLSLDIPFMPEEKAENPLCRDAQIDRISYDIVVPDVTRPVLVIKSTVQTANIGQFGESKADLEVSEAQNSLRRVYRDRKPALVAMIDGVGFRSNTQGLHGVLRNADEFAQFKTIWKVPVIASYHLGLPLTVALPANDIGSHDPFLQRHAAQNISVVEQTEAFRRDHNPAELVEAGEALLLAE